VLFFLRASPKRDTSQPPTVEYLEQVVKEWETIIDYRDQGKLLGAFSIWDGDSKEELDKIVTTLPMYPFAEWEINPLWTAEETLEKAKQALESVKA
jgi:muconolactone delta-isomerase